MNTLLEYVDGIVPDTNHEELVADDFKVCIVGKPNAGKSSLINAILQEERVIVTDIPGTTRDEIDIRYSFEDNDFVFIDTSGLRRKKQIATPADQFGISRTQKNIEKADCNLFIIDGSSKFSQQDKRIANAVFKSGKACLIAINKSDLMSREQRESIKEEVLDHLGFLSLSEPVFISAKKNRNIRTLLKKLLNIKEKTALSIETSALNEMIQHLQERTIAPKKRGNRLKIYYAVQTKKVPLELLLFVNNTKHTADSYIAYLKKGLRKKFRLDGIPITFQYRQKKK
jgi:GTP-binding protein